MNPLTQFLHAPYSLWDSSPWKDLLTMNKSISLLKVIPHRHFQRQTQFISHEYAKFVFKIIAYPYMLIMKYTLQEMVVYFFCVTVWTELNFNLSLGISQTNL